LRTIVSGGYRLDQPDSRRDNVNGGRR
jgi:hypothetical protein